MDTRGKLLAEVEAFLREREMPATRFGIKANGDRTLVFKLRKGRIPQLTTADKIRAFMARERKRGAARSTAGPKRRKRVAPAGATLSA